MDSNHVLIVKNYEEVDGPIRITLERPQSKKRVLQYPKKFVIEDPFKKDDEHQNIFCKTLSL